MVYLANDEEKCDLVVTNPYDALTLHVGKTIRRIDEPFSVDVEDMKSRFVFDIENYRDQTSYDRVCASTKENSVSSKQRNPLSVP